MSAASLFDPTALESSDTHERRAAQCVAACDRALVAGRCIVAYEVVARRGGRDETLAFQHPLVLMVEADLQGDSQMWKGDWLESLWRVRVARPLKRLAQADMLFVRGTFVSRTLRTRHGAIAMAANERSLK